MTEPFPGGAPPAPRERLEQRSAVLLVAGVLTVLLAAAVALLPVPYAVFSPGPVLNTLGTHEGKRLIAISGRKTYPTSGQLDMTTVSLAGGPGRSVTLVQTLVGWVDRDLAVVPEESVFPPGQTAEESEAQDKLQMISSQESATVAALTTLDIPVPATLAVAGVDPKAPAAASLADGDVLVQVQGRRITGLTQLRQVLQTVRPGEDASIVVRRGKEQRAVTTRTTRGEDGRTLLGVFLDPSFTFPFKVDIEIENVVGPSAGMMFALGIVDLLTPGVLTGGKKVAGTGTIDADGVVGPIGGIQQKLIGARRAGAEFFLAPAGNCAEVAGHVPDGLTVVRVATLDEARDAVQAIAAGRASSQPAC